MSSLVSDVFNKVFGGLTIVTKAGLKHFEEILNNKDLTAEFLEQVEEDIIQFLEHLFNTKDEKARELFVNFFSKTEVVWNLVSNGHKDFVFEKIKQLNDDQIFEIFKTPLAVFAIAVELDPLFVLQKLKKYSDDQIFQIFTTESAIDGLMANKETTSFVMEQLKKYSDDQIFQIFKTINAIYGLAYNGQIEFVKEKIEKYTDEEVTEIFKGHDVVSPLAENNEAIFVARKIGELTNEQILEIFKNLDLVNSLVQYGQAPFVVEKLKQLSDQQFSEIIKYLDCLKEFGYGPWLARKKQEMEERMTLSQSQADLAGSPSAASLSPSVG